MKGNWKESATLILATMKNVHFKNNCNYLILTCKRGSKASFMRDLNVFPGGVVNSSDSDEKWLDHFSKFNIDYKKVSVLSDYIPPIAMGSIGEMPKLLSLKITAIRETFEETGILLCFDKEKQTSDSDGFASFQNVKDLQKWQREVHNNSSRFLTLCEEYNCCPDVNNIHLWSNWLTPAQLGAKTRYDTIFFMAATKEMPLAKADKKEIESTTWISPDEIFVSKKERRLFPPPQFYEISRLARFKDLYVLTKFAQKRAFRGCRRWIPALYKSSDGIVSLLPGDGAYVSYKIQTKMDMPVMRIDSEKFRSQAKQLHRMEFCGFRCSIFVKNFMPSCGHVLPLTDEDYENDCEKGRNCFKTLIRVS